MLKPTRITAAILFLACAPACDDAASGDTPSASDKSAAATSEPNDKPSAATEGSAQPASAPAAEPGSVASLREKALGVLTALKKSDAKAAGEFCLGKHREGLTKYLEEHLAKGDAGRGKAFRTWDGKLGEIRIDGKSAYVVFNGVDVEYHVLSFRQVEGEWSLFDVPSVSKEKLASFGQVAAE